VAMAQSLMEVPSWCHGGAGLLACASSLNFGGIGVMCFGQERTRCKADGRQWKASWRGPRQGRGRRYAHSRIHCIVIARNDY
jgi:hypothetical protein